MKSSKSYCLLIYITSLIVSISFFAFFWIPKRPFSLSLIYSLINGTFYLTLYLSLLVFYKRVDLFCFIMMSFYWILFSAELSFSLSIYSILPFYRLLVTRDKVVRDLLSLFVVKSSMHFSILRGFYEFTSESIFWHTSLKRMYYWYELTGLRDSWLMVLNTIYKTL